MVNNVYYLYVPAVQIAQKNALEERYAADMANLREQLQQVSANNGILSKTMREKEGQLQRQLQEMNQHIEALKADKNALQVEVNRKLHSTVVLALYLCWS